MAKPVGNVIQKIRTLRGLSLNATAKIAKISPAYLQKLERNEVREPSPHVLHRLADALSMQYTELMQLYGYLKSGANSTDRRLLGHALDSENLTTDELEAVTQYLNWYRHSNKKEG